MTILLTKCGTPFVVDDDVAEAIRHLAWKLDRHGYVFRCTTINGRRGRSVFLHRFVANVADSQVLVDHIDNDRLNCTRANLRPTNRNGNAKNRIKQSGTSSQFKGVTKVGTRWQAQIAANRRHFFLGVFEDEHEAAHEYNKAAIRLHGEFARLNPVGYAAKAGASQEALAPQGDAK